MIFFKKATLLLLLLLSNWVLSNSWSLKNLSLNSTKDTINLRLDSLKIPFVDDELNDVFYECQDSISVYPIHSCSSGTIAFQHNNTRYKLKANGWINLKSNEWKFQVTDETEKIHFYLDSTTKNKLKIKFQKLKISYLANFINQFAYIDDNMPEGLFSADFDIDFKDLINIHASYEIKQLSWEAQSGDYVLDSTSHNGSIELVQSTTGMYLNVVNHLSKGEGLVKDMYVLFDRNPITTDTKINFDNQLQPISLAVIINSTPEIEIKIAMDDWYEDTVNIQYAVKDLTLLNKGFLASYFEIIGINNLNLSGASHGKISVVNGKIIAANLVLKNIDMEMQSKKIQMQKINAQLNWSSIGKIQISKVSWSKLLLAGMPIKQSELSFSSVGQQLTLQKNIELPIFDGSIVIHELSLQELFKPQINIDFNGQVKPISIALITKKMGWPNMNGTISGNIPAMKKVGRSIAFDGSLDLNIFDGKMQINNLSTERLFGIAPVIAADIQFQQLNLQQITSTFDFGAISGLIDGKVDGLRITNWKADRMDGYFHTVKTKGVKQTISQRAIDNISSIGGIQGALSRSFLRFFDYFKYKEIGIGCKLRNSICEMKGIDSNTNSYKLVEGKGIPSINIIGYRRFIDWEIFLDRLLNAGY